MKYLFFFVAISFSFAASASTIYVSADAIAPNQADSWATATTLHHALAIATGEDQIWVKRGTYLTSAIGDRAASFVLPAGVAVYGGFAGTESSLAARPVGTTSTLSGDLGRTGDVADNAYTVVIMRSNQASILDGFVLTGGNGRNFQEGFAPGNTGGALFIERAPFGLSTHRISNCHFRNNQAHNGGAVYVNSGRPSFEGCTFIDNSADFNGGAIYNQGSGTEASPIFRNCEFLDNKSNYGAGMANNGTNGASNPLIIECNFDNNVSVTEGSAIYNITFGTGVCEVVMEGCSFQGNMSILGGDVSGNGISPSIAERARQNSGGTLRPVRAKK
ncbi:MAG: hypothetical protein AAFZ52_08195 [Bacteroidota bacterium]